MCRDSSGHLIAGFTQTITAGSDLETETQALNLTLKFLQQTGKTQDRILLESNCLVLVDAVKNPSLTPWEHRALFEIRRAHV